MLLNCLRLETGEKGTGKAFRGEKPYDTMESYVLFGGTTIYGLRDFIVVVVVFCGFRVFCLYSCKFNDVVVVHFVSVI